MDTDNGSDNDDGKEEEEDPKLWIKGNFPPGIPTRNP